MPMYEYHCAANGRTIEVRHGMDERPVTWGQACALAGEPVGDTPADTPVERVVSVPTLAGASAPSHAPCARPGCCRLN